MIMTVIMPVDQAVFQITDIIRKVLLTGVTLIALPFDPAPKG